VLDRGGLATRAVGYDGQHQASEARRSAKQPFAPTIGFAGLIYVRGAPGRDIPEIGVGSKPCCGKASNALCPGPVPPDLTGAMRTSAQGGVPSEPRQSLTAATEQPEKSPRRRVGGTQEGAKRVW
jgi:hypothetical protein